MVKYNNKKVGRYRSKLEAIVWKTRPKKKGVKYGYETIKIPYSILRNYVPDFTLTLPSGRIIYVEAKGYFRAEDKLKMRMVKLFNPELDIRMVFSSRSAKNAAWCVKNGFPYAVKTIPAGWLDE